jgi:hypothetical protein
MSIKLCDFPKRFGPALGQASFTTTSEASIAYNVRNTSEQFFVY